MNPLNSSISSSDEPAARRRGFVTLAWALLWLVVLDIAVNIAFSYPSDPKNLTPGALPLYFDYGRSMEGRLRRSMRVDPAQTAPITLSGWYDPLEVSERPAKPGSAEVTIYGMSHAVRLANALQEVSPNYQVRSVGAPGASTNWSYGAFLRDEGNAKSRAVVLAIMSSTLPMILSPTPMDWNTSFAMPYTADRFVVTGQGLKRIRPPYESFEGYTRALYDPASWKAALAQFSRTDPFFDPLLVRGTWLDNSTVVRLLRRAWSQQRDRNWRTKVLTAEGYDPNSEPVRVANAIVADFARQARAKGMVPVIYVVDSFGYGDQLYRALASTLARDDIPYIATHDYVDPMDPRGYLPDSHFTEANDLRLARQLTRVLDTRLQKEAARRSGNESTQEAP
jgi:hypothetical protein